LLLTAFTLPRRARQTLVVYRRVWHLRTLAILVMLAGGLCLGLPFVYGPAALPPAPSATAERRGSQEHDRGRAVTGGTGDMAQPGRHPQGHSQAPPLDGPMNLTGAWTMTNTVVETSYPPYRELRLGFRLVVHHAGPTLIGTGEKYLENGRPIPVAARSPIRIQGRVTAGAVIEATFEEDGRSRRTQGHLRLTMQDQQSLTGTFASTAANARGTSQWIRASARQGAPAPTQAQPRQEGRVRPPPPD
jgi:hypothetical protein